LSRASLRSSQLCRAQRLAGFLKKHRAHRVNLFLSLPV
jgi:hypothetical protein